MPTIRINETDKRALDRICQAESLSQPAVFHMAIELLERARRNRLMQEEFESLAGDPHALAGYRSESEILDRTAADGLRE